MKGARPHSTLHSNERGKSNNYIKGPSHLMRTDSIYLSDSISIILCKYKTIQRKFEEKSLSGPYKDSKLFINARNMQFFIGAQQAARPLLGARP